MHTKKTFLALFLALGVFTLVFAVATYARTEQGSITLNGNNAFVRVNDSDSLDGFTQATWNVWVNQKSYKSNAGLIGKYIGTNNQRSYLIRTTSTNEINVVLSQNGSTTLGYTSALDKDCGIRANNEWTMLTVTYANGTISYYRNGELCDTDRTSISKIYKSSAITVFGGANGVFFNGSIDNYEIYSYALSAQQVKNLYTSDSPGPGTPPGNTSAANLQIPVIIYHQIASPANNPYIVSPSDFDVQMKYIKDSGFTPVTLDDYAKWRKGQFTMPSKAVIIAFDDGRYNVYTNALPIMDKYGFVASVNVVTNYADRIQGGPSYMHWPELSELEDKGWSIESHGVNHSDMLTVSESEFRRQLSNSSAKILANIGQKPTSFTFPFHSADQSHTTICGEYYELCWTVGFDVDNAQYVNKTTPATTYRSLKRIIVKNDTTLSEFKAIFTSLPASNTSTGGGSSGGVLVGKWNMDENTGSLVRDSSTYSHHGVLNGGAVWTTKVNDTDPPANGTAGRIILDGANDRLDVADASNLDGYTTATWNMWVYPVKYVEGAGFAQKYNSSSPSGFSYIIRTQNNSISVSLSNGTSSERDMSSQSCAPDLNKWNMITVVYTGSTLVYYKNGVQCDQDTTNIKKIYNSAAPVQFGVGIGSNYFNGSIDEFTFYKHNIDSEQVLRLYKESAHGQNLGQSIPFIVYHNVVQNATARDEVTITNFQQQMKFLKDNGFTPITMKDYNNWRKGQFTMPKKPVVMLFDDGRYTIYQNAVPILDQYGFVASIPVVTNYANRIQGGPSYMHWPELSELEDKGWSIESHGVNHTDMLALNESAFRSQLTQSLQQIQLNLLLTPVSFTFPFHRSDQPYAQICGEYYDLCWTWGEEPATPDYTYKSTSPDDYRSLKRISIRDTTTLAQFATIFGRETNIVGEWYMNENTGTVAQDSSGYDNDAYLKNGARWG